MIKKIIFVTFLFFSLNSFGQDIDELRKKASSSSNSELVIFIKKAKDQGLSLKDAEKQLILIGGKADEIKKLRDLWNKKLPEKSEIDLLDDSNEIESQFGETDGFVKDSLSQDDEVKRFGSDFFKNKNIVESPQLFVATPSDYRLGPGDELIINLFGASEITYSVQITRNGNVKFDKLAPVYLSGLSIRSASKRLKQRLSKIYTGLNTNNPIEKVDLELSLQKARSIVVNITGQVEAPGTYTISGFSSVLNALYAAGGPNDVGTYRDINIIRNGKVIYNVDLYDYFSNGIYPNIYLRDQDVILVKPYEIETELVTGFKQLALFEIKKDEVVNDLINLSGGASSNSYKSKLFIERFDDFSKKIVEIDEKDFYNTKLNDGDKISFKEINSESISGAVKIGGAVYLTGDFQLENNKSVNDLINSAKGLSNDLLGDNAILYRSNKGLDNQSISINLKDNHDAYASADNYLNKIGWKDNEPCFYKVELSNEIPKKYLNVSAKKLHDKKKLKYFRKYISNENLLDQKFDDLTTSIITPDKDIIPDAENLSPAYIVFDNYEIILKWNRSLRFSLAVCTLKDKFRNEL